MGFVGDFVSDIFGGDDAEQAANITAQGSEAAAAIALQGQREGIEELRRQYDTSRADFAPIRKIGLDALEDYKGEAFTYGHNVPGLYDYTARRSHNNTVSLERPSSFQDINSKKLQADRFNPNSFNFDVNEAINSPELQATLEQGYKGLDRTAGKNRQLGSGNRMLAAQEFGRQALSDEIEKQYGRQYNTFNTNEGNRFNAFNMNESNRLNTEARNAAERLQAYGMNSANRLAYTDARNNARLNEVNFNEQSRLNTERFNEEMRMNELNSRNQNRLQEYGLKQDQWLNKLNRRAALANIGQTTTSDLANLGAQYSSGIGNALIQGGVNQAGFRQGAADARAAGILGKSNAEQQGWGQIVGSVGQIFGGGFF